MFLRDHLKAELLVIILGKDVASQIINPQVTIFKRSVKTKSRLIYIYIYIYIIFVNIMHYSQKFPTITISEEFQCLAFMIVVDLTLFPFEVYGNCN